MARFRVFATCDIGAEALARLAEPSYELEVYGRQEAPPRDLLLEKVASGIDGLISTLRDRIDEEVFRTGQGTLKVVAQYAVGFDNIDREAANRYRIPFTNTPDVLTQATAELALFMMGCAARRMAPAEKLAREGGWTVWHPSLPLLGDEVGGKSVAAIGAGRIGGAFLAQCAALNMDLLFCSRSDRSDLVDRLQSLLDHRHQLGFSKVRRRAAQVSLQEALERADFVSLHVPLTEETRGMIDAAALARMKPTAILVNTSRGAVVDEAALCQALKERRIAGAALDVFAQEPLAADSPFLAPELADRLRLYPHIGSGTRETRLSPDPDRGMAGRCVQGLIDVLEGRWGGNPADMPFVVNKEAF